MPLCANLLGKRSTFTSFSVGFKKASIFLLLDPSNYYSAKCLGETSAVIAILVPVVFTAILDILLMFSSEKLKNKRIFLFLFGWN